MNPPIDGVDARTDRVAQGAVGIALLAAFVFRLPLLVPALSLLLAVGALAGPRANAIHLVFESWVAPRLPTGRRGRDGSVPDGIGEGTIAVATVRAQDALAAALLGIASIAFPLGIGLVGWVLVLGEGVIAIVAATTRVHVADQLRRRL